ncbi:MAG: MFS transporter [Pseudolabrys sp.]|nr:MFS transporter [Pseudolabrys sp.]MDP2297842.1 MFS transporter [Pseudolabrys sp.]
MNEAATFSTGGLLQQRPFVLIWLARVAATIGYQMMALVIGWKIYEITGSAFDLGLVGLIQFVPAVVLTLLIGHTADRYDRRLIVQLSQGVYALAAALITVGLLTNILSRELLFFAVFMIGCARAFELPTGHALVPATVPVRLLPRAVAAWTSANQVAVISGPALGGLIYAVMPVAVSLLCVLFFVMSIAFVGLIRIKGNVAANREPPTFSSVLAGFHYIRRRKRLLGVITLDLFVVLLGAATALLPIFAKDILQVGPVGLGLLRSAPAVGALAVAIVLSHYPIERHIGLKMFGAVAIFGMATITFGLSSSFPLSLVALAVLGASDAVSVVIRFTLVQMETPDDMRGRVSAINYLFVGSSNTLGEFESGAVAAWLGAVPSVLIGGIGSLVIAATWMGLFPDLRKIDRYEPADAKKE